MNVQLLIISYLNHLLQAVTEALPETEFEFVLNPSKPRSKSFEIALLKDKKGRLRIMLILL
jgi:hypothetical protein